VETLKGMAGQKWSPEIEKAWVLVYNKVAAAMARPAVEFEKMVRSHPFCVVMSAAGVFLASSRSRPGSLSGLVARGGRVPGPAQGRAGQVRGGL
jgi:hypothetical protein